MSLLFKRKHKVTLSEIQGIPKGTFRCDVCNFVQPSVCICGVVIDESSGWDEYSRKTSGTAIIYTLCGICAVWLGFKQSRFPQGICLKFSNDQREKINALHKELEISKSILEQLLTLPPKDYEGLHELISQVPNFNELNRLRWSLLRKEIRELSDKLTRGEYVAPYEISSCQK